MATTTATSLIDNNTSTVLATVLGYTIGLGSFLLYTPIAFRIFRQKSANGLVLSTWWLKLYSYTCTDVYSFVKGYPLSTYIETLVITVEAFTILILVAIYQEDRWKEPSFALLALLFVTATLWGVTWAPPAFVAAGQLSSAGLNSAALIPQFVLNYQQQSKGDYSPLTATLACLGCAIRLFTIQQLSDSDVVLLTSFGIALILNAALTLQILYYGVVVEGLTVSAVFVADMGDATAAATTERSNNDHARTLDDEGIETRTLLRSQGDRIRP